MPTLGELAALNQGVVNAPGVALSQIGQFQDIANKQLQMQRQQYDFEQQQANDALDIATSTYQNPIWKNGTAEQTIGLINQTREQLKSRGIPINKGGMLDQVEGLIADALLTNDNTKLQQAREMFRDAVNQFGQNRASRIQPQLGTSGGNPASVTTGGIGSGGRVQVGPVDINDPSLKQQPSRITTPIQENQQNNQQVFSVQYYPNRPVGSITPFSVGEEADIKRGEELKTNFSAAQRTGSQYQFNINKGLDLVNKIVGGRLFDTGFAGNIEKGFEKNFQNNANYQALAKIQAQQLIQNANSGLLRSDAAQGLVEKASGIAERGEQVPPSVLRDIMIQNAGALAQDKYFRQAYSAFLKTPEGANNPGNSAIFEREYQRIASETDFRVFQIAGIMQSNMSVQEKQKAVRHITENTSSAERQAIKQQGLRMEQLVKTGK